MKNFLKILAPFLLIVFVVASFVFGAYFPFVKARAYIKAIRALPEIKSVEEFIENYEKVFNVPAPLGDEEVLKFLGNDVLAILLNTDNKLPDEAAKMIVEYIEKRAIKTDTRHLILLGQMHAVLWERYGMGEGDFEKAEMYYLKAKEIGPKLPPVLYQLLDLYVKRARADEAKKIGEEILKYWPEDEKVKAFLSQ